MFTWKLRFELVLQNELKLLREEKENPLASLIIK